MTATPTACTTSVSGCCATATAPPTACRTCSASPRPALTQLRDPDKLRPWLYAIARDEALRRIRDRQRETVSDELPDAVSHEPGPEAPGSPSELADLVSEAAGGLSDRDRSVLELAYRHGLDGPDLADALGVSQSNANTIVHRLRETVERALGALLAVSRRPHQPAPVCRARDDPRRQGTASSQRPDAQTHRPAHRGLRYLRRGAAPAGQPGGASSAHDPGVHPRTELAAWTARSARSELDSGGHPDRRRKGCSVRGSATVCSSMLLGRPVRIARAGAASLGLTGGLAAAAQHHRVTPVEVGQNRPGSRCSAGQKAQSAAATAAHRQGGAAACRLGAAAHPVSCRHRHPPRHRRHRWSSSRHRPSHHHRRHRRLPPGVLSAGLVAGVAAAATRSGWWRRQSHRTRDPARPGGGPGRGSSVRLAGARHQPVTGERAPADERQPQHHERAQARPDAEQTPAEHQRQPDQRQEPDAAR